MAIFSERNFDKLLPKTIIIICILQPVLDVISFFSEQYNISNYITLILRFSLLAFVFISAFALSERKKVYYITVTVLAVFTLLHIISCYLSVYNNPLQDLTNLIRIYQMPVYVLCFYTFLFTNKSSFDALKYGIVSVVIIIAAIEIVSVITNTNPYTYENKGIGIIGWFYDSSAQSAVLSTLVPIFLSFFIAKFKDRLIYIIPAVVLSVLLLFMYATRLAYISLIMTLAGLCIALIITDRTSIKSILTLAVACVLVICSIPFSPMQKNQELVSENAVIKQEKINELIAVQEKLLNSNSENYKAQRLEAAYTYYMGGMIERFGIDAVAEEYGYSEKASDICDVRRMKNTYCSMLIEEQGVFSLLFGAELADMSHNGDIYDVENDLHGIFYLCGISGLILLLLFFLYFAFIIIKKLLFGFKEFFTVETVGFGIALIANLMHIYATCGVLRRPSSSIYLSIILAIFLFITRSSKKGNGDGTEIKVNR